MPSYYVPKKNRCKLACPSTSATRSWSLFKARTSSVNTKRLSALTAIRRYTTESSDLVNKGNREKRGSGGNSYAAYLARKIGSQISNRPPDGIPDCCNSS